MDPSVEVSNINSHNVPTPLYLNVSRGPNQAGLQQQGVDPAGGEGHSLPEGHPQLWGVWREDGGEMVQGWEAADLQQDPSHGV